MNLLRLITRKVRALWKHWTGTMKDCRCDDPLGNPPTIHGTLRGKKTNTEDLKQIADLLDSEFERLGLRQAYRVPPELVLANSVRELTDVIRATYCSCPVRPKKVHCDGCRCTEPTDSSVVLCPSCLHSVDFCICTKSRPAEPERVSDEFLEETIQEMNLRRSVGVQPLSQLNAHQIRILLQELKRRRAVE